MNKLIAAFILLLPALLLAQPYDPVEAKGDTLYSQTLTGFLGSVTADGVVYSQFRLMPEFRLWKFYICLDLDFLVDAEGNVRTEDWNELRDLWGKLYYFRFASRNDPLYFKIINIDNFTLGQGLLMNRYSNTLLYPTVRNTGAFVGLNTSMMGLGAEFFTHNVVENEILAGRLQLKPLSVSNLPILKTLTLGTNVVVDRNQWGKYRDRDGDGVPDVYDSFPENPEFTADSDDDGVADETDIDIDGDNSLDSPDLNPYVDTVYPGIGEQGYSLDTDIVQDILTRYNDTRQIRTYSVDYRVSLYDDEAFQLYSYGELAFIEGHGQGLVLPGFGAKFWILNANLELRRFTDGFLPGYFDNLYDDQRAYYYCDTDPDTGQRLYYLRSKDEILAKARAAVGWYGSLVAELPHIASLTASYQDMYGENLSTGKSLLGQISVYPSFIHNLEEASLSYAQKNLPYINFAKLRTPGAEISGSLYYRIAQNANLIGKYSEHYHDLNNDGQINTKEETIKMLTFGVEFTF